MKLNLKNITVCVSIVLLIAIIILLKLDKLVWFDEIIYNFVSQFICEGLTEFFKFITNFASFPFITIAIIIILMLVKDKSVGIMIAINSINGVIINKILKSIFVRPRPDVLKLVKQDGYSFPSGHTMAACIFYGILIYLIYKSDFSKKIKNISITILSILILLIGISRIYLGVHYASDVVSGYLFSLIYLISFISLVNKIKGKK